MYEEPASCGMRVEDDRSSCNRSSSFRWAPAAHWESR